MHINLVAWNNSAGQGHDISILKETLTNCGHTVTLAPAGKRRNDGAWSARGRHLATLWKRCSRSEDSRYDLNIMIEHVRPAYFRLAKRNAFIPNQEWFSAHDEQWLNRFDKVFAKSHLAVKVFSRLGASTHYIGFTSADCLHATSQKTVAFLHIAGVSHMKGTHRLVEVWKAHPEWPLLHVVQSPTAKVPVQCSGHANIRCQHDYLETSELRTLQNRYAFHVCLSEAEGWGHYIVEAMSCGAIVITCNAPPMNEHVQAGRGLLVEARQAGVLNASDIYHFDEGSLEAVINDAVEMTATERDAIGSRARRWFVDNQREFPMRLCSAIETL